MDPIWGSDLDLLNFNSQQTQNMTNGTANINDNGTALMTINNGDTMDNGNEQDTNTGTKINPLKSPNTHVDLTNENNGTLSNTNNESIIAQQPPVQFPGFVPASILLHNNSLATTPGQGNSVGHTNEAVTSYTPSNPKLKPITSALASQPPAIRRILEPFCIKLLEASEVIRKRLAAVEIFDKKLPSTSEDGPQ